MSAPVEALEFSDRVRKRAEYEAFEFRVDGTTVHVRNGSHPNPTDHEYEVHVRDGVPRSCTCPADDHYEEACKHRVAVAIRTPIVEACAMELVADGGEDPEASTDDPELCPECVAVGDLPCWECVRSGRKEISD